MLSGSTYGRSCDQVVPVAIALLIALPLALIVRRELDLLALDEDTPRLIGVSLERERLLVLLTAAVLTAMAVSAVGVVGFVGLSAPHIARALVGARSLRVVPVAMLVGGLPLAVADTIGRTVISPAQVPAGLVVARSSARRTSSSCSRARAPDPHPRRAMTADVEAIAPAVADRPGTRPADGAPLPRLRTGDPGVARLRGPRHRGLRHPLQEGLPGPTAPATGTAARSSTPVSVGPSCSLPRRPRSPH